MYQKINYKFDLILTELTFICNAANIYLQNDINHCIKKLSIKI